MKKECGNLLCEIERLEKRGRMLRNRLKNMLDIVDSRQTERLIEATEQIPKQLTDAAARDFAAMRQISYVTMILILANFVAFAFTVNGKDIARYWSLETFPHYVKVAIALMLFTTCIAIIIQTHTLFHKRDVKARGVDGSFSPDK